jgi:hypothetical protein
MRRPSTRESAVHDAGALAVVEVTEKTKNVGVGKIRLNLDFSTNLFLDLSLLELDLV